MVPGRDSVEGREASSLDSGDHLVGCRELEAVQDLENGPMKESRLSVEGHLSSRVGRRGGGPVQSDNHRTGDAIRMDGLRSQSQSQICVVASHLDTHVDWLAAHMDRTPNGEVPKTIDICSNVSSKAEQHRHHHGSRNHGHPVDGMVLEPCVAARRERPFESPGWRRITHDRSDLAVVPKACAIKGGIARIAEWEPVDQKRTLAPMTRTWAS